MERPNLGEMATNMKTQITEDEIMSKRTPNGGWTRRQLAEWGVPWPPTMLLEDDIIRLLEDNAAWKTVKETAAWKQLQDAYRPGTLLGDLLLARRGSPKQREDALTRLAERIYVYPKKPAARRALTALASEWKIPPATCLKRLLVEGLIFALAEDTKQPTTIRLGKDWIKGDDNKIANIGPESLGCTDFDRWIVQEARQKTVGILLSELFDSSRQAIRKLNETNNRLDHELYERFWAAEHHSADYGQILELLKKRASPRQRDLIELLQNDMTNQQIAEKMNVRLGTVKAMKHQLERRAAKIFSK